MIEIIEFPFNLGLKEPEPGKEPGVRKLPFWLKKHGFHDLISPKAIHNLEAPAYSMYLDPETGIRNADAIAAYAGKQAGILSEVVKQGSKALVLGGDCSILIGNMLGLKKLGKYGLFYMDGHTDYMLPELSQTGGAAGMDLAIAAGKGPHKLTDIDGQNPYVQEKYIWCVGNREYDEDYVRPIKESAIHYFDLNRLRESGPENCVETFLEMVIEEELDGFWVHFDVDILNNDIMPAVDSPEPGGLSYEEVAKMLKKLLKHEKFTGLQITILNPDLDRDGRYTREFIDHIGPLIREIPV